MGLAKPYFFKHQQNQNKSNYKTLNGLERPSSESQWKTMRTIEKRMQESQWIGRSTDAARTVFSRYC